ncbi:MAG: hypothetical protein A3J74_05565 [Elusimicrobia bacterium RIFCSPHIGHO2_02_FULL_57_9]|nr:MAG: hypothetical protein A3J74_05565 [Elusimicrobia bacterium RIFCSPHIGHO2_02_FULL_57_9]
MDFKPIFDSCRKVSDEDLAIGGLLPPHPARSRGGSGRLSQRRDLEAELFPKASEEERRPPDAVAVDLERSGGLGAKELDGGAVLDELGNDALEVAVLGQFVKATKTADDALAVIAVLADILDDVQVLVGAAILAQGFEPDKHCTHILRNLAGGVEGFVGDAGLRESGHY